MAGDISPFKINVPDTAIEQLKVKLSATSYADRVEFSDDWNYGSPLSDVKRLVKRWGDGFDWRKQEATLNELPQFTTPIEVDGFGPLSIHFLHQRSNNANSIPLLFVHGCSSSKLWRKSAPANLSQGLGVFWKLSKYYLYSPILRTNNLST